MSFSLPFYTLNLSQECSARELIVTGLHTRASICGCLVAQACVALREGLCVAEGRMFGLSYDTEPAVASTTDRDDSVCSTVEQVRVEGLVVEKCCWSYI